jgi:hypothetical protein
LINLLGVYHYDAHGAIAECTDLFGLAICRPSDRHTLEVAEADLKRGFVGAPAPVLPLATFTKVQPSPDMLAPARTMTGNTHRDRD